MMNFSRANLCFLLLVMSFIWTISGCSLPVIESQNLKNLKTEDLFLDPSQNKLTNKIIYFLPKGHLKLKYETSPIEKMTADIVYIPDPERSYLLTYHEIPWYKDDVTVSISEKGLLSSINVTTENQAGAIIGKTMEIAKSVISPPTLGKALVEEGLAEPKPFEVMVDPPKDNPENTANDISIKGIGTIHFERLVKLALPDSGTIKGVCFRPALPCKIIVTLINKKEFSFIVMIPNWSPVISIDITRGVAEKIQQLKFTDGMLTEVKWKKSSSDLLALLSVPAETAKGLVGLPLDLFKVQVQSDKK